MVLKIARQIARLTQRQLAERSGVDESTISLLENEQRDYGTVGYRDIIKIARALGVDPALVFPVPDETGRGARKKEDRRATSSRA